MKKYLCLLIATLLLCGLCTPVSVAEDAATVYVSTYAELKEQLESATYAKIVLTDDVEDNAEIHIAYPGTISLPVAKMKKELVLDLNGYTLTINSDFTLESGCMLTLCDGKGSGTMRVGRMYLGGRFVLERGRIEYADPALYHNGHVELFHVIYVQAYSELIVNGGEINFDIEHATAISVTGGTLRMSGGSIKVMDGAELVAIRASYDDVEYEEYVEEYDEYFTGTILVPARVEISGGSIQVIGRDATGICVDPWAGDCIMSGGEIIVSGDGAAAFVRLGRYQNIILTGGTIKSDAYAISDELYYRPRNTAKRDMYYLNADGETVYIDIETKELSLPFSDVYWRDWYYSPAKTMHDLKIMTGYPDGSFQPQNKLSRAELVTMLYRYDGAVEQAAPPFTDVPANSYYAEAAAWAYKNGIVTGTSATTFSPNDPITREQLVTMLYRYAVYKGQNPAASVDATQFIDYAAVSDYAKPAVNWAVSEGLLTGKGNQKLEPQSTATRAETAALIARYIDSLE